MVDKKTWAARALPGVVAEREMEILEGFDPLGDEMRQVITILGQAAKSANDYAVAHGAKPVERQVNVCANCEEEFATEDEARAHVLANHRETSTTRDLLHQLLDSARKRLGEMKGASTPLRVASDLVHLRNDAEHLLECLEAGVLDDTA